jgi:ABC-type lipoprotein release transport system permease subunit
MMRYGLTAFAARRILLHPFRWLFLFLALASVTFLTATLVMVLFAIEATAKLVIASGPSLVVSRVDAGGWAAIDIAHAERIRQIPGVESATPRLWGILPGPPSITIIGDPSLPDGSKRARVGRGTLPSPNNVLSLRGLDGTPIELAIEATIEPDSDIVAHDVALAPVDVVRALLLIPAHRATDIAVESARDEENDALVVEIAEALKEPVRVVTRAQMLGSYRVQAGQRATLAFVLIAPAILALLLLVGITASGGPTARADVGKLKLIGWTSGDVARLHVLEVSLVGVLAVGLGTVAAYAGLFLLGGSTVTTTLLGWRSSTPHLVLSTEGAALSMVVVAASVLLPCVVAALLPAFRLARVDPMELTEAP